MAKIIMAKKDKSQPKAVSLFSGCGGSDLALISKGFDVVWANDIWKPACEVYRANIPNAKIRCGSIADVKKFPKAGLLVGCYPCQGYSQGGPRRAKKDDRNFLYRQFDRALRAIKPKAFVVENVDGMKFGKNHQLLDSQLTRYRLAGYRVKWSVLDAKDYGVAQSRRRIFLVGVRTDVKFDYDFPHPTHGPGRSEAYASQRDAIGKLPRWPVGEFNTEPLHWYYLSRNRRHTWGKQSGCIVGHWRQVPLHPSSPPLKSSVPIGGHFVELGALGAYRFESVRRYKGSPLRIVGKKDDCEINTK